MAAGCLDRLDRRLIREALLLLLGGLDKLILFQVEVVDVLRLALLELLEPGDCLVTAQDLPLPALDRLLFRAPVIQDAAFLVLQRGDFPGQRLLPAALFLRVAPGSPCLLQEETCSRETSYTEKEKPNLLEKSITRWYS